MNAKQLLESKDVESDIHKFKKNYIGNTGDRVFDESSLYVASVALLREYLDRKDESLNDNYAYILSSGLFSNSFVIGSCKMICLYPFAKSVVVDPRIMKLLCE